ncbi:MAG: metal ABC transporter ATP-binding protein [Oscillospiraceae bacterium]|nr:metal ABC transporter ATP-binding protein [Oscillospiraceae bacterium]MBQ8801126.1 metal ABC transporter ATP-binding protein [Clostridium sp.]
MINLFHSGGCHDSCCLKVQNVSVKIGGDKILKNVNLHVHCGQLVALIGPNGAGKSTLLKALLGEREFDGNILFSVPGSRRTKARIGYVPQSPNFDPGDPLSVADLFTCCLSRRPAFLGPSKSDRELILECLDRVHGEDLIDKRVGTLSGGELQRVLLALALEPMPNILILDEPLSGVDIEGQTGLMDMLDEIRRDFDLSILMTTHDFSMLPRYADRVVLIDHEVKRQGTPAEVLDSPEFRTAFRMKEEK